MDIRQDELDLSGVEETALLTLYARAIDSRSVNPILKDKKAEEMIVRLDPLLRKGAAAISRQLSQRRVDPRLSVHIPLRARKYDEYTRAFIKKRPQGVIVNIGCGLDTRFFRIDNGSLHFFDLDLPAMIRLKRQLLEENKRYRMLAQSVLDHSWMAQVESIKQPVLILAEGVFMYLPEDEVRQLVLEMQQRFPGAELVCELTNRIWTEGIWGKIAAIKMRGRLKMGGDAAFVFGVSDPRELETWDSGIQFLEKWFYMDDNHPKLGMLRIFRHWKFFTEAQYTAHYRLNP